MEREACCRVANAFLSRLELIWPISRLKISKMSKNAFLAKSSGSTNPAWQDHSKYTYLKRSCQVNLKCTELNPLGMAMLKYNYQFAEFSKLFFWGKYVSEDKKTRPPESPVAL